MPPPEEFLQRALPGPLVGAAQWGNRSHKVYFVETTDATLTEVFLNGAPGQTWLMADGDFINITQILIAAGGPGAVSWAKWYDNTKYDAEKIAGIVAASTPGVGGPGNAAGTGGALIAGIDADPGNAGLRAQVQGNVGEVWRWIIVVEYMQISNP